MNQSLRQVGEFHQTFNHPIGEDSGTKEDLKTRQLRIKLLYEELKELAVAGDVQGTFLNLCTRETDVGADIVSPDGNNVNKQEELDALCDLQYVLNGKIITAGLQYVFDRGFNQVHMNNMTKAHRSHEHALETVLKTGLEDGYKITQKPGGVILSSNAGKIIKPWDHKKVELSL
jgi:predicted HAD superfamily Cof-like phosphohydrolase